MRHRSVAIRSDVFTAGQHEAPYDRECGAGMIRRQHGWDGQRHETRALERANISGVEGDTLAAFDEAARRRHSHGWRRAHDVWDAGPPSKGQRGLLTLAQSTRTPYRFSAVLPPMIVPIAGCPAGSS